MYSDRKWGDWLAMENQSDVILVERRKNLDIT